MKTKSFFALMLGLLLVPGVCNGQEISFAPFDEVELVDLGLPSGTLWTTCNLEAYAPEEYGYYFAWGEKLIKGNSNPKSKYSWSTYEYGASPSTLTKYCNRSENGLNGFTDNKVTLDVVHDDVATTMDKEWRLPTKEEFLELFSECTSVWTKQKGVNGRLFTGPNGNSIFLPAAGYYEIEELTNERVCGNYWSSSLDTDDPSRAYVACFDSSNVSMRSGSRCRGRSIRPVLAAKSIYGEPYLRLNVSYQSLGTEGGEFSVRVGSNQDWTVACDQPWVTLSVVSGTDFGSFSVLVAANESRVADYAVITVTSATAHITQTIMVIRAGRAPSGGKISGHDYVDLGLPSGTLWASCNVGAKSPEGYGKYFAWGERKPKNNYTAGNLKYCTSFDETARTATFSKYTGRDDKAELDASDDAATANWGSRWRMPTRDEIDELYSVCTSVWTTRNGVEGRLYTGPNGNSIFLPAAGCCVGSEFFDMGVKGYYWSSSFDVDCLELVDGLAVFPSNTFLVGILFRWYGLPVRPVVKR